VGVSPIISGAVVRGMADACLAAIGVATSADAVALHYGARSDAGILDAWLIDTCDELLLGRLAASGIRAAAVPLWMNDADTGAALAAAALDAASAVPAAGPR
jgi:LPPG:FO 2-phospho-L-lactate transferase